MGASVSLSSVDVRSFYSCYDRGPSRRDLYRGRTITVLLWYQVRPSSRSFAPNTADDLRNR